MRVLGAVGLARVSPTRVIRRACRPGGPADDAADPETVMNEWRLFIVCTWFGKFVPAYVP